jgi:nucleotide-binding universal stress UspA family protein
MLKILLPVDGSSNALRAVQHVIDNAGWFRGPLDLHLLNVQLPVASGVIKTFIKQSQLNDYYRDEGLAALKESRSLLDGAKLSYQHHIGVGEPAATILDYAREKQSELIIMGSHGRGAFAGALLGSIAGKVVHAAPVPVLLVK